MEVRIGASGDELGMTAAREIGAALRSQLQAQEHVRMIFAAAPSQSATLAALLRETGIDWSRITAFHMDEYLGLPREAPQRFGGWLRRSFFDHVPLAAVHTMEPERGAQQACRSYAALLAQAAVDCVLLGIGTNGHLAFNDPPADLRDPEPMREVMLDTACREQQVFDGCFPDVESVPRAALTLTVPTLLAGKRLFCSVPGAHKSEAVKKMLTEPVSGACPATALRLHPACTVYLDRDSSRLLREGEHG